MRDKKTTDLVIFGLLVAIGVAGRLGQPTWCVTPIAAVTLLAGYWFGRPAVAAVVPLLVMLISDLALDGYQNFGVMALVYLAMAAPAVLGVWLRTGDGVGWWAKLVTCSLIPATVFWLTSNFAVWAWSTQPYYEKTFGGLLHCYTMAVPFFGRMMAGDLAFTLVLFGAMLMAGAGRVVKSRVAT